MVNRQPAFSYILLARFPLCVNLTWQLSAQLCKLSHSWLGWLLKTFSVTKKSCP